MSKLDEWYNKSGVRADPRRALDDFAQRGTKFFPDQLIPYLSHPALDRLSPHHRNVLTARHLYQYLSFTANFETRVVNRATERIANGRAGFPVSLRTRLDALKIYCDEGYHSLYSLDVADQIQRASGISALPYDFDPFIQRLDAVGHEAMPTEPVLTQLLQVVVFETLITAILNDLPRDPSTLQIVRDVVRDHARDEARHHAFFAGFFRELWSHLDPRRREQAARCLPQLITLSLQPDPAPVRASLISVGTAPTLTDTIIADVYNPERLIDDIRRTARHSLRLFESIGVLDVPGGRDSFLEAQLMVE
jgi:hypothetical protein